VNLGDVVIRDVEDSQLVEHAHAGDDRVVQEVGRQVQLLELVLVPRRVGRRDRLQSVVCEADIAEPDRNIIILLYTLHFKSSFTLTISAVTFSYFLHSCFCHF